MKPILCVSHQPSVTPGVAADVFEEGGTPHRVLAAWESDEWPNQRDISGLIVLGGGMNVDRLHAYPFLRDVRDYMRDAVEAHLPVLGICLGAQMLARVLGAEVRPSPVKEVGFTPVRATETGERDHLVAPFTDIDRIFQWHEDAFALPQGSDLLFTNEAVVNQAFRYGQRSYGVQFHFEVTERIISAWADETESLESEWGTTKQRLLDEAEQYLPAQKQAARACFQRFARMAEP